MITLNALVLGLFIGFILGLVGGVLLLKTALNSKE
jgi:ABC-type nitrate/sulfonate/bicarbonate transport system permease component